MVPGRTVPESRLHPPTGGEPGVFTERFIQGLRELMDSGFADGWLREFIQDAVQLSRAMTRRSFFERLDSILGTIRQDRKIQAAQKRLARKRARRKH